MQLSRLVEDGYAQSVHGKGVQVIYQPAQKTTFTVGGIESFQETSRRNNLRPITKVVRFETVTADETLVRESSFPKGSELLPVIDEALQEMIDSGEMQDLIAKWLY